ncbi:helix-turn-helix domain-containing protein [Arthrobacter sp. Br18]|uniref:excisionase family DNA-binding protein n=1 Tax=Arthrobacter sp. Br18 TaxID=1312954 RepID=UPI0009DDB6A2
MSEIPGADEEPVKPLRFLTLRQVAEELNTKESTIRALIRNGELPAIQVSGRGQWRLGRVDVEDYITAAYARAAKDSQPRKSRGQSGGTGVTAPSHTQPSRWIMIRGSKNRIFTAVFV